MLDNGEKIEVFISYSHADEKMCEQLIKHLSLLKRQGYIDEWYDRKIEAGEEFEESILSNLNNAKIILLLISSDFLASDYCFDIEMKHAMERHHRNEARVIPVILRSVDWHISPFGKLKALPKDGKPITLWADRDEAYTDVIKSIRKVVEEIKPVAKRDVRKVKQEENDEVLFWKIKSAVNSDDPIGFFPYCPTDEYDNEVEEIVKILPKAKSVDHLTELIHSVFVRFFDSKTAGDIENYQKLAVEIWMFREGVSAT